MKTITLTLLLLCFTLLTARELFTVNSNSHTISKIDLQTFTANNAFAQIGLYGNHVICHNQKLYIVNSGDHNIQIVDANTGANQGIIALENESNPAHILIYNDNIYITGLFSNKLYRININNTSQRAEINIGDGPTGLIEHAGKIYVAVSGYAYYEYVQGYVKVVDTETFTVVQEIPMPTNPQQLMADSRGYIHTVCTGNYYDQYGAVRIIDSSDYSVVQTISFSAFLTTISLNADGLVYLADAYGNNFTTYNPITYTTGSFTFADAYSLLHDEQYVYMLQSSWTGVSRLWRYTHNMAHVSTLNLGIGAVSMCFSEDVNSDSDITILPEKLAIHSYPNPFNQQVRFEVKNASPVSRIDIYNVRGQKVASCASGATVWDGKDMSGRVVPNGVYFARASNGHEYVVKKILKETVH